MSDRADLLGFNGPDLTEAAAQAERLMVQEIEIVRIPGGRRSGVLDPLSGEITYAAEAVAGHGSTGHAGRSLAGPTGAGMRALIRRGQTGQTVSETDDGFTAATLGEWEISIPWDAPEVLDGDVVREVVPASGRTWVVTARWTQALRTRQVLGATQARESSR